MDTSIPTVFGGMDSKYQRNLQGMFKGFGCKSAVPVVGMNYVIGPVPRSLYNASCRKAEIRFHGNTEETGITTAPVEIQSFGECRPCHPGDYYTVFSARSCISNRTRADYLHIVASAGQSTGKT